jgi:hypothetical protein
VVHSTLAFKRGAFHAAEAVSPGRVRVRRKLMSTSPENEFDLEKLFLPAWAQEPSTAKLYAKYEGTDRLPERKGDRFGSRPPRRDGPRREGPRREGGPPGDRRGGPGPQGGENRGPAGDRRGGQGGGDRRPFRPARRGDQEFRREPAPPLPEISISLIPDEKGVESLARQIKMTGRAYPLFEIALMILQKPERHEVVFSVKKNAEGQPNQPLFACALDDSLWLSEDEAISHVLKKHFSTFYQAERTATEPPKGKYTFVAQCGMSGAILGPPNYHDYQNQLRKLHAERFSRMPFETYKARVKIVRDEEVVKKWVDDQSWKTEYVCLNLPEPLKLENMEAVEKHFREVHKDNIIKKVETHRMTGVAARSLRSPDLARSVRSVWEDQRRFPLQIATVLSQQFASHGLQFFKVNKTVTHVSVARPHFLDLEATPLSAGIKQIVEFINAHPKCTRRKLVEALAPDKPTPAAASPAPATPADATVVNADQPVPTPVPAPAANLEPTPEQTALISDLHWLIHQGHVIEFANGTLDTAKKPLPKPPRSQPKAPVKTEAATTAVTTESGTGAEAPKTPDPVSAPANGATEEPVPSEASLAAEAAQAAPEAAQSELAESEPSRAGSETLPLANEGAEAPPAPVESQS